MIRWNDDRCKKAGLSCGSAIHFPASPELLSAFARASRQHHDEKGSQAPYQRRGTMDCSNHGSTEAHQCPGGHLGFRSSNPAFPSCGNAALIIKDAMLSSSGPRHWVLTITRHPSGEK
jgi:hypothetical protein